MTGNKKDRWAWVTVAVDKGSALQSIILAKSLAQVFTVADLVIFIDVDLPDPVMDLVADVFDVVFPVNLGKTETQFSTSDFATIFAWNLGMYEKCIVMKPDQMVVKNCDEYFELPGTTVETILNESSKGRLMTIFGMTPCYKTYKNIQKLSGTGKYENFAELLTSYFAAENSIKYWFCPIQEYNSGTAPETKRSHMQKIVSTSNFTTGMKTNGSFKITTNGTGINHGIYKIWKPIYDSLCNQLTTETISAFGLENAVRLEGRPVNGTSSSSSAKQKQSNGCHQNSIAIIGYSCRFPGANNSEEFWSLLAEGGDGIIQVPPERLFEHQLDDPRFTESKAGFLKCPIDEFDAKFFGISPREAAYMDPQQRLLVEVAWEALENAAIDPHALKGSNTGVFSGVWTHDYERLINDNTSGQDFHHVVLGNAFSATSARVSYFLGLNGPNIATESGCSSSMVGLHLACESLKRKETDLALALGANVMIMQFPFSEIPILAKDGHCKTFDESADGFGRAEGAAVVVLKRFSDAVRDGDRIVGLIRSSALSNEGTTSSFGTPSKLCQEIAVKEALKSARVEPHLVDYIEAHGTGTPIGDPIEFAALSAGYAAANREKPMVIGSVKTNIGHTESAAGLAGLIKVLLSMKHEMIPRHRNFSNLNPHINLDALPAVIPTEAQPWARNAQRARLAGVSSFGISGTNVHCIVEEPPVDLIVKQMEKAKERSHHILTISAKTENALHDLVDKYVKYFEKNANANTGDVTFTANTGRAHMKHKLFVTAESTEDLKNQLANFGSIATNLNNEHTNRSNIAFLFTGQGSQYTGMGKALYETNAIFQMEFDKVARIVKQLIGISLAEALWSESFTSKLDQSIYSQPSIFAVEYSLLKVWESLGITPDFVLGHSVGEFAAATAAGIINVNDAVTLICQRSELVQSLPPGGMMAVRSSTENVSQLLSEFLHQKTDIWLDIAVINSSEEVVVAGDRNILEMFQKFCLENSIKCQFLAATHAFHSRSMNAILKPFGDIASKIQYHSPKCQYISGTTGNLLEDSIMDGAYWERHARQSVNFAAGIQTLANYGCQTFIEIGAHPVLLALGLANLGSVENTLWIPSLRRTEDNWKTLLDSLGKLYVAGVDIKWAALDSSFSRQKLELPTYPFQRQKYWIDYRYDKHVKLIHPLLGRNISIAGGHDEVYEHVWNLKEIAYLRDHQVANITILPGAGFLELILAAGKHAFWKKSLSNEGTLKVENFIVECPLELHEDKLQKIQIVVSPQENLNEFSVKVYGFQNLNGYNDEQGWKQYSSATIFCEKESSPNISNNNFLPDTKKRCSVEIFTEDFYKIAPEIGIHFGPTFQSIEKVWKGSNEALAGIPIPSNAGNIKDYIYHPIVLDAMIQTIGLSIAEVQTALYLPVGVEKFLVINDACAKYFYAHATWEQGKTNGTVRLYNEENVLLAVMEGVRLVKTSISSFLNVINGQKNRLPDLYEEIWRPRANESPLYSRVDLSSIKNIDEYLNVVIKEVEILGAVKNLENMFQYSYICEKITVCLILKTVLSIGWKPELGCSYDINSVVQECQVLDNHINLLSRFFEILQEQGYLTKWVNNDIFRIEWKVIKDFPTLEELKAEEHELTEDIIRLTEICGSHTVTNLTILCAKYIVDVLKGNLSAVAVLFGTEDKDLNALTVYTEGVEVVCANISIAKYLANVFSDIKSGSAMAGSMLRIIEVGAGSGATSKEIMKCLQSSGISFQYTFTDISPHFLERAKVEFSEIDCIEYKLLNIENDPTFQGFTPFHYDVVIAANVIHATKHLEESVSNIRKLLVPSGIFILQEILGPKMQIDFIFGILDGYWRFKDYNLRTTHPCVTQDVWDKVLVDCNFTRSSLLNQPYELTSVIVSRALPCTSVTPLFNQEKRVSWALVCDDGGLYENLKTKLEQVGHHVQLIQPNANKNPEKIPGNSAQLDMCDYGAVENFFENYFCTFDVEGIVYLYGLNKDCGDNQEEWLSPVLNICKYIVGKTRVKTRCYFVSRGVHFIGDQGLGDPSKATMWAIAKCMTNELPELTSICVDLDPDEINLVDDSSQIFFEMFGGNETQVCYRNKKKHVNRISAFPTPPAPLALPRGRYTIVIPTTKKINDVTFRAVGKEPLASEDVEVMVKATALNFRDIFVILKPDMFKSLFDAVGTDFAGIVSDIGSGVTNYKVGDEVFGISQASCAASHVIVNSAMILPKPSSITFADACTLPSVFLTAYYCLVTTAHLKPNETILIHVASGGVGLIAIQIAKYIGANIIATAGSRRKRSYLRSIGIQHVFHSRDLSFGDDIKKSTGGRGVDMVLNSLTGSGFKETTLRICAQNARFVEMGKVNIWQPDEVKNLRPDVRYTIVDLEKVEPEEMRELVSTMGNLFASGIFLPLPYSRFEMVHIKEALNYFLKSQHIGKVVVANSFREVNGIQSKNELIFNNSSTYLITGGLGGIGLEVTKWMADCGAKNLVVVGRTAPNEKVLGVLNNLRSRGCRILVMQVDVGDIDQCRTLFSTIQSQFPPLRGVIHSAGALSDGVLVNQTWDKFQTVFNAKVQGGWNLHNLTKDMHLEHFVMFSSMAAIFAPMGQSNHAAANMFLDSLTHYRHSLGLPAQTINWGAWSEVGAAKGTVYGNEGMYGVKPFAPTQGIATLKFVMTHPNVNQIGVIHLDVVTFKMYFSHLDQFLIELCENKSVMHADTQNLVQSEAFWTEISSLSLDDRVLHFRTLLKSIIRQTLKIPESEPLDEYQSFNEMGLDSLMAVEMRNKLQSIVGKKLTLSGSSLLDHPTINSLSKHLAELTISLDSSSKIIEPNNNIVPQPGGISETETLIRHDTNLAIGLGVGTISNPVKPSEIKNVFLTGSTGHFGAYILKDLLTRVSNQVNVFCLIRGKSVGSARKRLENNFKKFNMINEIDFSRITIVLGDITDPQLGLSQSDYEIMSKSMDCIWHLAVKANHVEKYKISKSNADIRSVNVLGTVNILKFAAYEKTKRVYYTTSYTTANRLSADGCISEELPSEDNYGDAIPFGYALSKFVSEKILNYANQKGIPCVAIRYPTLAGHSQTGHFTVDTNFMINLFFISCRMGVFLDLPFGYYAIPIDVASKLTLELCFNDSTETGLYNMIQPVPTHSKDFVQVAKKRGIELRLSDEKEFQSRLIEEGKSDSFLQFFTDAYGDNFQSMANFSCPAKSTSGTDDQTMYKASDKLLKVIPDYTERVPNINSLLNLYMEYAEKNGILTNFGVKFN